MSDSPEVFEGFYAPSVLLSARLRSFFSPAPRNHVQVLSINKALVVYLMSMMCLCKKISLI